MKEWRVKDYRIGFRIGLGTPLWFWYRGRLRLPLEGRRLAIMIPGVQIAIDHFPGAPDWWGRIDRSEVAGVMLENLPLAVVTEIDRIMVLGDAWVDAAERING